ncbi:MAG: hypothetical protein WC741_02875 [Patescibacteria group bacterium]|jgi:hypothetical protein
MPTQVEFRPISPEKNAAILGNFVEVPIYRINVANFCVDGRKGERKTTDKEKIEGPYIQTLGGSLHPVALNWILTRPTDTFETVANDTINTLTKKGYRIGLHKGEHADNIKTSDCGFADNLGKIINVLAKNEKEIWETLVEAVPTLAKDINSWKEVIESLTKVDTGSLPEGHKLIKDNSQFADIQNLEGNHNEIAAVVNTQPNTTLDVDNNQETQAFNLDLWYVLEQAKELGIDETKAKLLSLGLYVATEKVLVEEKRAIRIPIIAR